jgi:uroporphyrin-III C-methyltransferase/precorrin-2 dehydrogenase/sirohydrochlorin ferrochelatase
VIAAATPEVNRAVAEAAEARRLFVNAVDDPANASAYLSGVIRREGFTLAVSSNGEAPGLTALLRQGLDALLPRRDLARWLREARKQRRRWKADGVPMEQRRPLLLDAINRLYVRDLKVCTTAAKESESEESNSEVVRPSGRDGHVALVGAGPGDPALRTRKAITCLRAADLVLYDALIDERILRYARHAQRFFVGKRAGRHALTQDRINALMIRAARRGRRVVRLKGGDPFVLGRGGEEALALAAAGVRCDVVPGITSAIAAPALAGIPVTHRGIASGFLVVSGHDEQVFGLTVAGVSPNGVTLVVLMGMAKIAALAAHLIGKGWAPATPAAVVAAASTALQRAWRGSLADLAADRVPLDAETGAGTIVIGEVVSVADAAFFESDGTGTPGVLGDICQPSMIRPPTAVRGCRLPNRPISTSSSRARPVRRGEITPVSGAASAWFAAYGQRQAEDAQMLRIKIPQGLLTTSQLYAMAEIGEKYSRGFGHITTRQNVQFHFVKLHDVEPAMRQLADTGLTTREACGNSVRNITGCPYAGVSADEHFDITPYAEELTRFLLRHRLSGVLPRKFKIAFEGCTVDHIATGINDLAFTAALGPGGGRGFRVTAGGGTALMCTEGAVIHEFLPTSEIFRVAEAVLRVFHRYGDYEHKQRNRMKFMIKSLGWARWRDEYDRELAGIRLRGEVPTLEIDTPVDEAMPNAPRPESPSTVEITARRRGGQGRACRWSSGAEQPR